MQTSESSSPPPARPALLTWRNLLVGGIVLLIIVILGHTLRLMSAPTAIMTQQDTAQINLEIDSAWIWQAGDCIDVTWSVERIQSMYFNTAGVIGADSRIECPTTDEALTWHIIALDGSAQDYTLTVAIWWNENMRRLFMAIAVLVVLRILAIPLVHRPLERGARFVGTLLRGLPWGRIGRGYTTLAVMLLNTFIFVSVVLFTLSLILRQVDSLNAPTIYSPFFSLASYQLVDSDTAVAIGQEFDLMGAQESYVYNPWSVFTERPFTGKWVNVLASDPYPTRRTIDPSSDIAGDDELLIWVFGGSTMFGWGVDDANTVASHLQLALQAELPNQRVRVVNHGHSWYFTSQELALYTALLRHDKPDIAIFIDGYNDSLFGFGDTPFFAPQAEAGWESQRQKTYYGDNQPWVTFNPSFPLTHLMALLQRQPVTPTNTIPPTQDQVDDVVKKELQVYRYNRDAMLALSQTQDVRALVILQPVTTLWRSQDIPAAFFTALEADAQNTSGFYALTDDFETDTHFVDGVHYSDMGSKILGSRVAALLLAGMKE